MFTPNGESTIGLAHLSYRLSLVCSLVLIAVVLGLGFAFGRSELANAKVDPDEVQLVDAERSEYFPPPEAKPNLRTEPPLGQHVDSAGTVEKTRVGLFDTHREGQAKEAEDNPTPTPAVPKVLEPPAPGGPNSTDSATNAEPMAGADAERSEGESGATGSTPGATPDNGNGTRSGNGDGSGSGNNKAADDTSGVEPLVFKRCADAYDAGVAPIRKGQPGYSARLDRDNDGIACELDLRL